MIFFAFMSGILALFNLMGFFYLVITIIDYSRHMGQVPAEMFMTLFVSMCTLIYFISGMVFAAQSSSERSRRIYQNQQNQPYARSSQSYVDRL